MIRDHIPVLHVKNKFKNYVPREAQRVYRRFSPFGLRLYLEALRHRNTFEKVGAFCFFVGYGRSGHSLLGQIINAHRNALISHEADAVRYLSFGYSWSQVCAIILRRSRKFKKKDHRWSGYKYQISGLSQGDYSDLQIIGDKKGGGTTDLLAQRPETFDELRSLDLPLRVIHHVRNPYDNISSITRREDRSLDNAIEYYFGRVSNVQNHLNKIRGIDGADVLETHHENLVRSKHDTLRRVIEFLSLPEYDDYYEKCAESIFDSENKSRNRVEWTQSAKQEVHSRASNYDFLSGYDY